MQTSVLWAGQLALPCDDPASLSLPQATGSLPTLLSISFPEVQSPEPAIRWEKQWQQRELLQHQHPGACRSPWKPREGRAPRDRQPAPCLLLDPHPSPRTHRRAWNRAPRPGWRGCWSRRPHWGGGSGAQHPEHTGPSANPGWPCPGLQHRDPAPPRWAGTRDTLPMVRPPTQVPCL